MRTDLPADLLRSEYWQAEIDALAAKHQVPGAQVGVIAVDPEAVDADRVDRRVLATGVTSLDTGVAVNRATLFQLGSITKVWTATLIMQLVDRGRLELDTRVVEILPDFTLADHDAATRITIGQLLTHTSGIDGDVFTDTGDGDDCVEAYVGSLRTAISVTEPGGPLSYCNAGFVVAGRVLEVLYGLGWDDILAQQLFRPLGLTEMITRARDAPLFRTAVGHVKTGSGPGAAVAATRTWMLPRSLGPAGLITGSAGALLEFAAVHLRQGRAVTGERILSPDAASEMQHRWVDLTPVSSARPGWGLGWRQESWGDETASAHGGSTIGQIANLYLFPQRGLAICALTNARGGAGFAADLTELMGAELGLTPPRPRVDPGADVADLAALLGTYESTALRLELTHAAGEPPLLTMTGKDAVNDEPDPDPLVVTPAGGNRFTVAQDGQSVEVAHLDHAGRSFLFMDRLYERRG